MATPPVDLNVHVGHESILQSFEVPVKKHLPSATVCPLCQQESLYIYVSPGEGGRWYSCHFCSFKGDSIELYQAGHQIKDISTAVRDLLHKQIIPMTSSELTAEVIRGYNSKYVLRRRQLLAFFEKAREHLVDIDHFALQLLQDNFLWRGYSNDLYNLLGQFVGASTPKEAAAYGVNVPKGFHHFLVLPYYDVPGRICSLLLIGSKKSIRIRVNLRDDDREDGLMMLGTVGLSDPIVFAVNDPIFALHLQAKNFTTGTTPLPMVVYGTTTDRAWASIYASRLIFWDKKQTFLQFSQSKKHVRSHIARCPKLSNIFEYFRVMTLPKILKALTEGTLTWPEAMKHYILNHDDRGEVCDTVKELELTAYELTRIYDLCSFGEREQVQHILGEKPYEQHVYVRNMKIIEADGAWWIARAGHRELGCNAIIRIDKAVHASDSGLDTYEGQIVANGKMMRFKDDMDNIETLPAKWLSKQMMAGGLGVPIIQRNLKTSLIEIAKQLYPIMYTKGYGRVGWNQEEQAFIFPNFSVRDGKIDSTVCALVSAHLGMPATTLTIEPMSSGEWDNALLNEPENAVLWASLACFMTNLLSPVLGSNPTQIGLIGRNGSMASIVGKHLTAELGLMVIPSENKSAPTVWNFIERESNRHGYPIWIDIALHNSKFVVSMDAVNKHNMMTRIPEGPVAVLAVGDAWTFIDGTAISVQRKPLPKLTGIMRYLAWLQSVNFKLPPATSLQQSVLLSLREWADEELHALDLTVFQKAADRIRTPDMAGLDQRLLWMILWIQEDRRLGITHDAIYGEFQNSRSISTKDLIVIDDIAQKVYIHEPTLTKTFKSLPTPDYDGAMQELASNHAQNGFETCESGFVLDLKYWDSIVRKWQQVKI